MQVVGNREVVYEFGKFVVDPMEKTVFADGVPVHLPAKEFETLVLLVENNGKALSKDQMLGEIWHGSFVEEGNLAKNISRLRKILDSNGTKYIETIPKHGYRFSAHVKTVAKSRDNAVIIEKQTVRRLTLSVDESIEPEKLALPSRGRSPVRLLIAGLLVIAVAGLGYVGWISLSRDGNKLDPYEPVRLTDDPNHDTGPTWTSDGRIRFHRIFPDNRTVSMVMNADGSNQSEITTGDRRIFSWSPDEKKILFQRHGDATQTYLANADGSGEVVLPFRGGNWSSDSKMLTYRAEVGGHRHNIFVYLIETGETRNITNSESFDTDPSFSPDNKGIVFASGRDGNAEIYSIDLDGGNLRRLTFNSGIDAHPTYSPDGTEILFTSDRENENSDVYVIRSDGTGTPVKITNFDKSNETAGPGGWSPDGTKIAFFSDRHGGKDDIYVVSAERIRPKLVYADADHDIGALSLSPDGKRVAFSMLMEDKSGELRILNLENGRTSLVRKTEMPHVPPAWSPDGNKLVYHDRIDGNSEILLVNPDGTGLENLSKDPSRDISPAWSPDGRRIVFLTFRGDHPHTPRLFEIHADGSDPRPLTSAKAWDADPAWSPDGELLFFSCDRSDVPGNLMDICQVRSDGTGWKRVLSRRDVDGQPAVSPDGRRIAFVALSDGNTEVYLMNLDGSGLLRLTRHPGDDSSPEWSPDSKRLFFTSNRSGRSAIYETEVPE